MTRALSRRLSGAALLAAAALATAVLWIVSRGKWSDAIIDSGREWIVPDALARGHLLYRDVVYWFGPVTPYFHAAFFSVFGSSFASLVAAGAVGSAGVLAALFCALRRVTGRFEAALWTSLAVPALVFMPDAGGSLLGMGYRIWHAAGFALLAGTLASRRPGPAWTDWASGAAAALSGLCRTEWGLAALLGAGVAILLRSSRPVIPLPAFGRLTIAFLLTFAGGLGYFFLQAGPSALLGDAPVLLFNLPAETLASVALPHPADWARGAIQMAYGAFAWLGAFVLLEILARQKAEPEFFRRRLPALVVLLLLTGACAAGAGFPADVLFCAAPLLCAVSVVLAARTPRGPLAAALGAFGTLGVLTSYRRPFFISDGPYVAPPLLFALVCAAGCLARALEMREVETRKRLSAWLLFGVGGLVMVLFGVRVLQYRRDDRVPISGTAGMLSARPEIARQVESLAESLRRTTAPGEGVVVFPEGEVLNYLSGRPNPIRHKLYLPGYLGRANEAQILAELERARPAAVVILRRPTSEYGPGFFGEGYGVLIRRWLERQYSLAPYGGRAHATFLWGTRKPS